MNIVEVLGVQLMDEFFLSGRYLPPLDARRLAFTCSELFHRTTEQERDLMLAGFPLWQTRRMHNEWRNKLAKRLAKSEDEVKKGGKETCAVCGFKSHASRLECPLLFHECNFCHRIRTRYVMTRAFEEIICTKCHQKPAMPPPQSYHLECWWCKKDIWCADCALQDQMGRFHYPGRNLQEFLDALRFVGMIQ